MKIKLFPGKLCMVDVEFGGWAPVYKFPLGNRNSDKLGELFDQSPVIVLETGAYPRVLTTLGVGYVEDVLLGEPECE